MAQRLLEKGEKRERAVKDGRTRVNGSRAKQKKLWQKIQGGVESTTNMGQRR